VAHGICQPIIIGRGGLFPAIFSSVEQEDSNPMVIKLNKNSALTLNPDIIGD